MPDDLPVEDTNATMVAPETTQTPEAAPASASDPFLEAWSSKFELPEGVKSGDELSNQIENTFKRAQLLQEGEDESTLREMREARAWRAQNASKWTAFEQWQQQQAAGEQPTQQYQQYQQPQYAQQPTAQQVAEFQLRYKPMKVDQSLTQYLERDPDTGLFRAKLPELAPRAHEVNQVYQQRQSFIEDFYNAPDEFVGHLAHQAIQKAIAESVTPLQDQIAAMQQGMTPIQQQSQMQALVAFESQYRDMLYAPSITTPMTQDDWSPVGQAYLELLEAGLAPEKAVALVQRMAPKPVPQVAAPVAAVAPPKTPTEVKKGFLTRAKEQTRSTGQPTQASGTVVTALKNGTAQNTGKMSERLKFQMARKEAEAELLEQS